MTRFRRLLLALLLGFGLTLGAWPTAAEPFPRTSARWQTCVNVHDHRDVRERAGSAHLDAVPPDEEERLLGGRQHQPVLQQAAEPLRRRVPLVAAKVEPQRLGAATGARGAVPLRSGDQLQPAAGHTAGVPGVRGIFLHVKNSGATAGCIGITDDQMVLVLRYLRPGDKITIRR